MAYVPPILKQEQFITITVDTKDVRGYFDDLRSMIDINLLYLYRQIADSTTKRMRKNVSGRQPYGTGYPDIPPTVRRRGRIYDTIGYRSVRTDSGPYIIMGAIQGTTFGRQLAEVQDAGATIHSKTGKLIFPPWGSPARDPATGEQVMTATQTRHRFYSQWDAGDLIWIKRTKTSPAEVGFVMKESVKIPARHMISGEMEHVQGELDRKLDTCIDAALRLERLRI